MRSRRDTVNSLQIASPCPMAWNEMEGDDRKRYCNSCKHHVFNISEMDVEEAAALVSHSTDELCIRLYRRRDGTVLTKDCPVGLRAAIRRRVAAIVSSMAMGAGVLALGFLRTGPSQVTAPTLERSMVMDPPAVPEVMDPDGYTMTTGMVVMPAEAYPPPDRLGRVARQRLPGTGKD